MIDIEDIEDKYRSLHSRKKIMEEDLKTDQRSLTITNSRLKDMNEVHAIWIELAKQLQLKTTKQIEAIVTSAIQTVYERDYQFKLDFQEKRGNITCTPLVIENGKEYSPKDSMGGGMLDIIGFALRITLHAIQNPRTRNIFILDEPFRFCGSNTIKAAKVMAKLSHKLKFQVLLVTHNDELEAVCDRTWHVTKGKYSKVKEVNQKRTIKRR